MAAVAISLGVDPFDVAQVRWAWARELDPSLPAWGGDAKFVASVAHWMTAESRTVWLGKVGERAVSMVCLTEYERMPSPGARASGCWGYLGHLYVHTDCRGAGLGREMIDEVVRTAIARNYRKLVLSPTPKSVSLYKRCGFSDQNDLMLRVLRPGR